MILMYVVFGVLVAICLTVGVGWALLMSRMTGGRPLFTKRSKPGSD